MSEAASGRPVRVGRTVLCVSLAGALAGGCFGNLGATLYAFRGGIGYGVPATILGIGLWWGVVTGLIAALVWCRMMFAGLQRNPSLRRWRRGAWIGMWVGVLSTVLLHALLIGLHPQHPVDPVLVGLPFGVVVGAGVGALCGRLCKIAPAENGDKSN
jgi:hypothetical protein